MNLSARHITQGYVFLLVKHEPRGGNGFTACDAILVYLRASSYPSIHAHTIQPQQLRILIIISFKSLSKTAQQAQIFFHITITK